MQQPNDSTHGLFLKLSCRRWAGGKRGAAATGAGDGLSHLARCESRGVAAPVIADLGARPVTAKEGEPRQGTGVQGTGVRR